MGASFLPHSEPAAADIRRAELQTQGASVNGGRSLAHFTGKSRSGSRPSGSDKNRFS